MAAADRERPWRRGVTSLRPRVGWILLAAVLSVLLLSGPAVGWSLPSPNNYGERNEATDSDYLWGNLTWDGTQGSISWSANENSPKDSVTLPAAPAGMEFASSPLPRALHLNASRLIQFDLLVASSASVCVRDFSSSGNEAGLQLAVYAGGHILAGSTHGQYIDWPYTGTGWTVPPDPPGWTTCRYRMPTEIAYLPAGTVLKVVIVLNSGTASETYGLGGDHRSVLRLPFYSPEETFYRGLESAGNGNNGVGAPSGGPAPAGSAHRATTPSLVSLFGGTGFGGGAVVGAAVFTDARTRRRAASCLLVLTLLLVALSGCTAPTRATPNAWKPPGVSGPGSSASTTLQSAGDSGISDAGYGTVLGLVHDDLMIPIAKAHVSVVGSNNFTDSDNHGQFAVKNVPPRSYTLRISKDGYRVLETPIRVVADRVTRIDATLVPLVVTSADARPHVHDYWNLADTRLAFDDSLGSSCTQGLDCSPGAAISFPEKAPGDDSGNPNTVIAGTYSLDVTVTWDKAAIGIERMGLMFQDNSDPQGTRNESVLYPRESGVPFHIQSSWEMDDAGHQIFTTWVFSLYKAAQDTDTSTTQQAASTPTTVPMFHAKVLLRKGVVPLEAPHPDYWGSLQKLRVSRQRASGVAFATNVVYDAYPPLVLSCFNPVVSWATDNVAWGSPRHVIPEGTTWLNVEVKQDRPSGIGPVGHFDWNMVFKPGDSPPRLYNFPTGVVAGTDGIFLLNNPGYRSAGAFKTNADSTTYTWIIPVKETWPDGFYSKKSAWGFAMYPTDSEQACIDVHESGVQGDLQLQLTVTAHRDAMPQ